MKNKEQRESGAEEERSMASRVREAAAVLVDQPLPTNESERTEELQRRARKVSELLDRSKGGYRF